MGRDRRHGSRHDREGHRQRDEGQPWVLKTPPGTVEAWGRSAKNPVNGLYGLKKGLRGRLGMYLPPLLEALGLAEVTHEPRNNRMRAL